MRRLTSLLVLSLAALNANCHASTEPRSANIDVAYRAWLKLDARAYSFEVETRSMLPSPGFYRVRVDDGVITQALTPNGERAENFSLTVDRIWDGILRARERGEVNSVQFNLLGVPIEADLGTWANDGGVHYSVRRFARH